MTAPINLGFIFAIFFLTLGPLKLIPTFYGATHALDGKTRLGLALKSATLAFLILVVATVVGSALAANWRVSREALLITGGFLLLIGSLRILSHALAPPEHAPTPTPADPAAKRSIGIVISPLAIPGIITPWGLVALLLFTSVAEDQHQLGGVAAMLVLIMLLNIVGMIFAGPVMRTVGLPAMSVLGWVFSILQAALGITFLVRGLAAVFGVPWHPTPL
jgi:multiple antibiotic resistance protein